MMRTTAMHRSSLGHRPQTRSSTSASTTDAMTRTMAPALMRSQVCPLYFLLAHHFKLHSFVDSPLPEGSFYSTYQAPPAQDSVYFGRPPPSPPPDLHSDTTKFESGTLQSVMDLKSKNRDESDTKLPMPQPGQQAAGTSNENIAR